MQKQKKFKSLGVNAFLNAFKSGMSILFPLITYPYAFRILHADGIGKVDYSTSIVNYFLMIASLGIATYAVREGAKVRHDQEKFEKFSNQVFSINIITTLMTYIILILFLIFASAFKPYRGLIILLSLSIGFTTLGIEWINTIYEDYLYVTIRSIVTYIITLILLFLLVRNEGDYYYYALLTVVTNGVICITNWKYCRRYVHLKFTWKLNIKSHIKPILTLFANSVATSIYVSADTTMIGWISGDYTVGLYSIAGKVYSVVKKMLVAMYTVTISRISFYVGQGDIDNVKKTYTTLLSNLTLILIPAGVGLAAIAREIILIMGGVEYLGAVPTLRILSVSLIGAIFGGAVTYCLNIPLGREKYNVIATVLSAIINIGLNVFLIPMFKQNGAALTTAISEFFVFIFCVLIFKDFKEYVDLKKWGKNLLHSGIGAILICLVSFIVRLITTNVILILLGIVSLSCLVYALELYLLKNQLIMDIIKKISSKIKL